MHGSTNNTFHINGQPFASRTGAFDPGVLQVESIAQSAERDGLKVAQIEWAGGRNASIQGRPSTSGRSSPAVASPRTSSSPTDDDPASAPSGSSSTTRRPAGQAPFPGAAPVAATGWTGMCRDLQPGQEMRLRVLDFGIDKYGLNAYDLRQHR